MLTHQGKEKIPRVREDLEGVPYRTIATHGVFERRFRSVEANTFITGY